MKTTFKFNWSTPLLLMLLYAVTMAIIALFVIFCFPTLIQRITFSYWMRVFDVFGTQICLLLVLLISWRFFPFDRTLLDLKLDLKKLILILLIGCGLSVMSVILVNLMRSSLLKSLGDVSVYFYVIEFISLCVMAPAIEELFFRGIIFSNLRKHYSFWFSAIYSSALFAISHISPTTFLHTFIIGFVLCSILQREKKIVYCIIIHILVNVLIMLYRYIYN